MLLQTNSYVVPKEKRTEHARLMQRFRQTMLKLGCDAFEVYEQTAANWAGSESAGRFVQMMRFRDRKHQQLVQAAERSDPSAQELIKEFVELINFPYQQQQGYFATGFYHCLVGASPLQPAGDANPGASDASNNGQPDIEAEKTGESRIEDLDVGVKDDSDRQVPNL
jgi:hypothetical protein